MDSLQHFQMEAIDRLCSFYTSVQTKGKVYLATGLGMSCVITTALRRLYLEQESFSAAVLCTGRLFCQQLRHALMSEDTGIPASTRIREHRPGDILITTYQDAAAHRQAMEAFQLIICADRPAAAGDSALEMWSGHGARIVGFFPAEGMAEGWFFDAARLFCYTLSDAMRDGYMPRSTERGLTQQFLLRLLPRLGYEHVTEEAELNAGSGRYIRPDIIAEAEGHTVIFEVKSYRSRSISKPLLDQALSQFAQYSRALPRDGGYRFALVLPCEIDEQAKLDILTHQGIVVWDIRNLVHLCGDDQALLQSLQACIPYAVLDLSGVPVLDWPALPPDGAGTAAAQPPDTAGARYISRLEACPPGRKDRADKQYEELCAEIIQYLFGSEFYITRTQQQTSDKMFRMDMQCSLKGTTEFWRFLINFYRTKFVVFEFKNYRARINQNLIYTTEKYLFPAVLRNVAFIVSRKGFDANAEKAALGCLRESGKLIVGLTDEDLKAMLTAKADGEEPSDYLLRKAEDLLMAVSK